MDYFVDSNVIIGYYFDCGDNWGSHATTLMKSETLKYSGLTSKAECFGADTRSGRCRTIKSQIFDEFGYAIAILTETKSPVELYATSIDEKWRIVPIAEDLLQKYEKDSRLLISKFRAAKRLYEIGCNEREKQLLDGSILIFHVRTEKYTQIYKMLDPEIDDKSDIHVILDAHDFIAKKGEIVFVTGDYQHIVPNIPIIIGNTSIREILPLGNYTG